MKNGTVLSAGEKITIDGSSGTVYIGPVPTIISGADENYRQILEWADKYKRMKVYANCETIDDVAKAVEMGAEGIGLCRTEHMFFKANRIDLMARLILSESTEERDDCLKKMLELQREDFLAIFRLMSGRNVTIRLLDPPLSEFLPNSKSANFNRDLNALAQRLGMEFLTVKNRVINRQENNPMMGFRGCRISIVHPEITEMQTTAIIQAALQAQNEGFTVFPEILIPLVCSDFENEAVSAIINAAAERVFNASGGQYINYKIGCMLEVPRAFLRAESIAKDDNIKFVSIGSNDLTQLMFGYSRDDTNRFLPVYLEKHILASDPFVTVDRHGVGSMIQMAVKKIKSSNPRAKIGICGGNHYHYHNIIIAIIIIHNNHYHHLLRTWWRS